MNEFIAVHWAITISWGIFFFLHLYKRIIYVTVFYKDPLNLLFKNCDQDFCWMRQPHWKIISTLKHIFDISVLRSLVTCWLANTQIQYICNKHLSADISILCLIFHSLCLVCFSGLQIFELSHPGWGNGYRLPAQVCPGRLYRAASVLQCSWRHQGLTRVSKCSRHKYAVVQL